jgi:hypothetical protein
MMSIFRTKDLISFNIIDYYYEGGCRSRDDHKIRHPKRHPDFLIIQKFQKIQDFIIAQPLNEMFSFFDMLQF